MSDLITQEPVIQLQELVEELRRRLRDTRSLLEMYDTDPGIGYVERGYAQGIREETAYLVRILDRYELD